MCSRTSSDAAIYVNKGHDCKVYNNTVFECAAAIQLRFSQSTGWVRNNLVKRPPSNPGQSLVELRNGATALANEANSRDDAAHPGVLAVLPRFVRRGGDARIVLEKPGSGPCTVFDAAGRRAMTFDIPPGARSCSAPVGRLPVGTYWLRVGTGTHARVGRVVVVP